MGGPSPAELGPLPGAQALPHTAGHGQGAGEALPGRLASGRGVEAGALSCRGAVRPASADGPLSRRPVCPSSPQTLASRGRNHVLPAQPPTPAWSVAPVVAAVPTRGC